MADPLRLAELLCARLCHDLSGPLGSLTGALELASGDEAADPEIMEVATQSAQALGRRLRLFRAAWAGDCGELSVRDVTRLASGLPGGSKTRLDVNALEDTAPFPPPASRVLLNLLMLAAESLPRGGKVVLAGSAAQDIVVLIEGPGAAWPAGLALFLADETAAWAALTSPRGIQGPVTALIARQSGLGLSMMMPGGTQSGPAPLLLRLV